jgi:hypothetical protein
VTISTTLIERETINEDVSITADENAPWLVEECYCSHCNRPGPTADNSSSALALALAWGWRLWFTQAVGIGEGELIQAADLRDCPGIELICPTCAASEFDA